MAAKRRVVLVLAGLIMITLSATYFVVGFNRADQIGSAISALAGIAGLALSTQAALATPVASSRSLNDLGSSGLVGKVKIGSVNFFGTGLVAAMIAVSAVPLGMLYMNDRESGGTPICCLPPSATLSQAPASVSPSSSPPPANDVRKTKPPAPQPPPPSSSRSPLPLPPPPPPTPTTSSTGQPTSPSRAAFIKISPSRGSVGTHFEVSGHGFANNEKVRIFFGTTMDSKVLADIEADASGSFAPHDLSVPGSCCSGGDVYVLGGGVSSQRKAIQPFQLD